MPRSLYPWEREPTPTAKESGQVPGPVWTVDENLAPPELYPRTFQAVTNRYEDWAIPVHDWNFRVVGNQISIV
jgi:hypothetical protein